MSQAPFFEKASLKVSKYQLRLTDILHVYNRRGKMPERHYIEWGCGGGGGGEGQIARAGQGYSLVFATHIR